MNELALFAGAGGGILGGKLLGWRTVCAVERDAFAAAILAQRQNDGCCEPFPIWSDVETFDGRPWRGIVDVVSGGFPCTDISCAGKGAGIEGEESGLWREFARILGEVRHRYALVENSPMLTLRGLGTVLGDLAALGYDARWGVLSAADAIWLECLARGHRPALDHLRERIWIVAEDANAGERRCGGTDGRQIQQPWRAEVECAGDQNADGACIERERSQPSGNSGRRSKATVGNGGNSADAQRDGAGCVRQGPAESEGRERDPESVGNSSASTYDQSLGRLALQWWPSGIGGYADGLVAIANPNEARPQRTDVREERQHRTAQGLPAECDWRDVRGWWSVEPAVGRLVHGLADRVDRCKALGNGQVPAVVRLAWRMLGDGWEAGDE